MNETERELRKVMGKFFILVGQPAAKSRQKSTRSPHFRKEYSHWDIAVSYPSLFGLYCTESD
jgi:hypothetical protein